MASGANLGIITKGQLAWLSEHSDQDTEFVGLPAYKSELKGKYEVSRIGIEKEGGHLKCNLIFCGFLAMVAGSGAAWVFLTQGQGGFIPAVCLSAISAGFVIAMVIMVVLTVRTQKGLESEYNSQTRDTVPTEVILQAMEHADVSGSMVQAITGRLNNAQRKEFIQNVYAVYDTQDVLCPRQEKVFKALMKDPALLELIPQKGRAFALKVLHYADQECPESLNLSLFDTLVRSITTPKSPDEAALLAKCPVALQRYIDSIATEVDKFSYKLAFLEHTAVDTPDDLILRWLEEPRTMEEANIFARHPLSVEAYAKTKNDDFALKMLKHLPGDSHLELLHTLLVLVGHPSNTNAVPIYYDKHPIARSHVISNDEKFAVGYLQFANENIVSLENVAAPQNQEDVASYAREPKAVARLALFSPLWFGPSVVCSLFSAMHIQAQIEFLQMMDTSNPHSNAAISFILSQLLTKEFVQQNDNIPESAIKKEFGELLGQFGRWPELVAKRLFETNFGTEDSLLKHELFVRCFFKSMSKANKEACVGHAAACLNRHGEHAVTECTKWLMMQQFPVWLTPVLANSPDVLARALCSNANDPSNLRGNTVISTMTPNQVEIYEQKLMEYFLTHYEKVVFEDRKGSPGLTDRLIARMRYLQKHPEWSGKYPILAKRYVELFVNAATNEFDLQKDLMQKYLHLFDLYTVTFNGCEADFPACRLAALSPVLSGRLSSGMKGAGNAKTITLDDAKIDIAAARMFIEYLKTGELEEGADALALSYLAHFYQMGHLSTLCTQALQEALGKDNYKVILEAAVNDRLWDLLTICLDYISRHGQDRDIVNYSKNPATVGSIHDAILLGIRCQQLGITISYQLGKEEILTSPQFGRYLSIPMGVRHVHLERPLAAIEDLKVLTALIGPTTVWSTQNPSITQNLILVSHQHGQTALTVALLQWAENEDWNNPIMIPKPLDLYILTSQQGKKILVAACLQHIQKNLNASNLLNILTSALHHQLEDLTLASLIFVSKNNKNIRSTEFLNTAGDIKKIIELGITCANEEIEISYQAGEHHVLVKSLTEDNPKRGLKGNKDKVFTALCALHKIRPITHLEAEYLDTLGSLKSEMQFLNENIQFVQKPRP